MGSEPAGKLHLIILAGHGLLAVAMLVAGLASAAGADGWADLASVAVVVLVAIYVVGIVLSWVVCRFALHATGGRIVMALVGPPIVVGSAILLVRLIG